MKIFKILLILLVLGAFATSCTKEKYALGDLTPPTNLAIATDIVGKTADSLYGNGFGAVNFTFSANDAISYKVNFGDGSAVRTYPDKVSHVFNKLGTNHYKVAVTALGKGGTTIQDTIELDVYYAYVADPAIVTLLTGDSPTGKKWRVAKETPEHLGNGPGPGRSDGNAETFIPTWWQAAPFAKEGKGIYDDVYTFTSTKMFTHTCNNDLYGIKARFAIDFDPLTPGVFGGYGDEWILSPTPDYTEGFNYDGEPETATSPRRSYITFAQKGHCGFFNGAHRFMILDITPTTMWLRGAMPGTDIAAWYVKLIVVE